MGRMSLSACARAMISFASSRIPSSLSRLVLPSCASSSRLGEEPSGQMPLGPSSAACLPSQAASPGNPRRSKQKEKQAESVQNKNAQKMQSSHGPSNASSLRLPSAETGLGLQGLSTVLKGIPGKQDIGLHTYRQGAGQRSSGRSPGCSPGT